METQHRDSAEKVKLDRNFSFSVETHYLPHDALQKHSNVELLRDWAQLQAKIASWGRHSVSPENFFLSLQKHFVLHMMLEYMHLLC